MKIYSKIRVTFYALDSDIVEVRTTHLLFGGLFMWTTSKSFDNKIQ